MPNWSATNYAITSSRKEDLKELCNLLNTMPNQKNTFGRYWMGNLVAALGKDPLHGGISCRGTFDPNPEVIACFGGPDVNEEDEFAVDADGVLRLSTVSAWSRCPQVEALIAERWPGIRFAWKSTDEFGNFHHFHDPEHLLDIKKYVIQGGVDGDTEYDDFASFSDDLRVTLEEYPNAPQLPQDLTEEYLLSDEFADAFVKWREKNDVFLGLAIWKEI